MHKPGSVPFDQNFRKFRFKLEWKRKFPETRFRNFGRPLEVFLFSEIPEFSCSMWHFYPLLYGCVSRGLGTTQFPNLVGWNWYWPTSTIAVKSLGIPSSICQEVFQFVPFPQFNVVYRDEVVIARGKGVAYSSDLLISARPQRQTNAEGCRIFGDLDELKSKDTIQKTVDWSPRRREERK